MIQANKKAGQAIGWLFLTAVIFVYGTPSSKGNVKHFLILARGAIYTTTTPIDKQPYGQTIRLANSRLFMLPVF